MESLSRLTVSCGPRGDLHSCRLRAPIDAIVIELAPEVSARLCSLADLRATKLASGRPRDLVNVAELDEPHG